MKHTAVQPHRKDIFDMTIHRLSGSSVKVQLSAEELRVFLPENPVSADSPQMLRMLSFLLAKAESVSGIAFSALPVTVELMTAQDGSLAAYFTVQEHAPASHANRQRIIRLAARFTDAKLLQECCGLLQSEQAHIRNSVLYQENRSWILTLKLRHARAAAIRHILLEYGSPYRLTAINRARLSEYCDCILQQDAVRQIAEQNISLS